MTIYVATTNAGKLRDFAAAAAEAVIKIAALPGMNEIAPAPEDEDTFEANAIAKAMYYSRLAPGLAVLADDSGLEVDALHGAPGVHSARFAADAGFRIAGSAADHNNNEYLLRQLKAVPQQTRTARYRCVLALARDENLLAAASGAVEGEILATPRGSGGFGYDPLFFLPERDRTMAELDLVEKQRISHRGRAFRALIAELSRLNLTAN
jgi:XTP/dITP diphosphohydrolase